MVNVADQAGEFFTVAETEKITKIADSTVRRYIRQHGARLKIRKDGKSYLIAAESLPTIKRIRGLYDAGKQSGEVDKILADEGAPLTVEVPDDTGQGVPVSVAEAMAGMRENLQQIAGQLVELKAENKALADKIDDQRDYIDQAMKRRDARLIEALRPKQEDDEKTDKPIHGGWLGRIFSRK